MRDTKISNMSDKFHQIRLQLSSKHLIELFTWLHDNYKPAAMSTRARTTDHPIETLRTTIYTHMLSNLDACQVPYVAVGDDLTESRLAEMAFGDAHVGEAATKKSSADDYLKNPGPYVHQGPNAFNDPILDRDVPPYDPSGVWMV